MLQIYLGFGFRHLNTSVGLVGSGTIARLVAKKFKNGFDCKIKCYNDYLSPKEAQDLGLEKVVTLEQLVAQCDIVSVHAPLTAQTENMFHRGIFDKANPDLIFINTARGGIVDEDALYNALVQKKIKAAATDVFKMQPPDPKNPLLALDNFIGTIHIGGSTKEALERNGNTVADNVFKALGI